MCLTIDETKHSDRFKKAITLKKDMRVYKKLHISKNSNGTIVYDSFYRYFQYEPGMHYYQTEDFKWDIRGIWSFSIDEGLHSLSSDITKYPTKWLYSGDLVVGMIIPKGAEIFYGDEADIVSSELIFPEKPRIYEVSRKYDMYNICVGVKLIQKKYKDMLL